MHISARETNNRTANPNSKGNLQAGDFAVYKGGSIDFNDHNVYWLVVNVATASPVGKLHSSVEAANAFMYLCAWRAELLEVLQHIAEKPACYYCGERDWEMLEGDAVHPGYDGLALTSCCSSC